VWSGQALVKILYRCWFLMILLASVAALNGIASAQDEDRPDVIPRKLGIPQKKDLGPRALAVLQLSANGKASLVPIAILINGKFWDASAYKADPVPMALEPGTVYEAERTGSSQGLFTVNTALHSNAVNAANPWIATGAWTPAGSEKPATELKAEGAPVGIDTTDAPPRLTRTPTKNSPPATSTPSSSPSSGSNTGSSSGDEPPRLSRPKESSSTSNAPASTPSSGPPNSSPPSSNPPSSNPQTGDSKGSGQAQPSQSQPSQSQPGSASPKAEPKASESKPAARPRTPEDDSGASAGERPRLRRGKPAEPFGEEEVPGYSKPGVTPPANAGKVAASAPAVPVQLIPAISDAGGPAPHSFNFEWLKDEEGERRQQLVAMAQQELRAYLTAQRKNTITATPGNEGTGHLSRASNTTAKATAKTADPVLENVQMRAYDLWTNNEPVVVFSAQAHAAPAEGTSESEGDLRYSILLVTYPDIYNNFHKLYTAVTDPRHLDVTPRLELVDAVDADGDGRGELLFKETTDSGTGWVVYRATADTLWKMFDSLNPE
jgi:hypothetical protein